jgi:hypothetical protein
MKTYYDITVKTTNGDTFQLKGVSFSMMMQLANQSDSIQVIEIKKEYSKKVNKY